MAMRSNVCGQRTKSLMLQRVPLTLWMVNGRKMTLSKSSLSLLMRLLIRLAVASSTSLRTMTPSCFLRRRHFRGGAASSSDAAPRSPPPLPPPVDAPRAPPRGRGATTYYVPGFPGAKIAYYEDSQIFEATCGNKAKHGRCRKTKTRIGGIGEEMIFKPQKGRPCGFLLAWILHGHACTVRTDHLCFETSWQQRKDARASLKACAAGRALLERERPKAADDMLSEMEEPP
jgi:hypothetical protein